MNAARGFVRAGLKRIGRGHLELADGGRIDRFGPADAELRARIEIHDPRAYSWALRGSTGLGEGYVAGLWTVDELVALARIACRNLRPLDRLRQLVHPVVGPFQRAMHLVPRNDRAGARDNISAHYDLGNSLFAAFLDERMMYSAGVFPSADTSLEQAQLTKLERICTALDIGSDDHVLEIGTGWGGFAIHAATTRGCRVTTTTISREQHAHALAAVRELGLEDRVEVLLRDYRDLEGTFDKLVSIEMIEAVGWQYFGEYFARCAALTRDRGAFFLQAIVIGDDAYEAEKASRSFSNKHIFPGGCLPSQALINELGAANGIPVVQVDDITDDYAATLAIWRERFNENRELLRPHGYDDRFSRLWNFYLAFAEGGFRERRIRDLQLVLAKPGWTGGGEEWRSATRELEPANRSS